jgi:hypothetical protein
MIQAKFKMIEWPIQQIVGTKNDRIKVKPDTSHNFAKDHAIQTCSLQGLRRSSKTMERDQRLSKQTLHLAFTARLAGLRFPENSRLRMSIGRYRVLRVVGFRSEG